MKQKHNLNKDYYLLWSFHLLSLFGGEMTRFALPIWLFQREESFFYYCMLIACGLIPRIFFSPIAGGIVDNLNKKRVLLSSGLSLFVISLLILALQLEIFATIWWLAFPLVFLISVFSNTIHITTLSSLSSLIHAESLLRGNSLLIAAESASLFLSPLIAGYIYFEFGASLVFITDFSCFLLATTFLLTINSSKLFPSKQFNNQQIFAQAKNGILEAINFVRSSKANILLLSTSPVVNFFFSLSFSAFIPMLLTTYQFDTRLVGWAIAMGGAGQLIGSFISGYLLKPNHLIFLSFTSMMLLGVTGPFFIGISHEPIFLILGYTLTLAFISIINSVNHTYWQKNSPTNLQGSVFGVRRMISASIAPIGALLASPMVDLFEGGGFSVNFIISGLAIFFLGFFGFIYAYRLRMQSQVELHDE